jgi:hypothetical protein
MRTLVQFPTTMIRRRAERAIIVSQKARHVARLAQIPFDFAQGKLSLRKKRLFRMTNHKNAICFG